MMGSGVEGGYRPDMSQTKAKAAEKETLRRPQIPESEFSISFSRSSGAGGQNVNKRDTKAEVRWHVGNSSVLTPEEKVMVRKALAHKMVGEEIQLQCQDLRTQLQNKTICIKRIHELVWNAIIPEKERIETKMSRGQKAVRLDDKTREKRKKEERRRRTDE
jgi:ribosome-associated protein